MKGDFTRSTFNPEKHYSSVRMQQGRLQLDADWNEQVDILAHLNQTQIQDLIGLSGVPNSGNNAQSFEISQILGEKDFTIASGRIYVDGILCELEEETKYTEQPDYPNALQEDLKNVLQEDLDSKGNYIVYLDVWQRHITSIDDPQIREVALGNVPDTATRTKTVCQVKLLHVPNGNDARQTWEQFCPEQNIRSEHNRGNISLTPSVSKTADLENHLYRIEIHQGGKLEKATFKWSRDNGFVVSTIQEIKDNIITIVQNNDDSWQLARPRQWVEILRNDKKENWELCGKPGILARLMRVSGNRLIIDRSSLKNSGKLTLPKKYYTQENPEQQYKVRLWDYTIDTGEKEGIAVDSGNNSGFIPLEGEEISVKFDKFDKNKSEYNYQTGDYWLIPTRRNNQKPLEWPLQKSEGNNSYAYLPQPPNGIKHYYSRLALIKFNGQDFELQEDYRKPFSSLVNCLDRTMSLNLGSLQLRGQLSKAQGTISSENDLVIGDGTAFTKELEGFAIIADGQIRTVEQVMIDNKYQLKVTEPFDPALEKGTPYFILPQGQGKLTSNSNNEISYIGDGLAELAVGYSIVAQGQIRTIQEINQNTQIIRVNEAFDPSLEETNFSYQQPLLLFSDSSGATQLIFDQNLSDPKPSLVMAGSQANTQLVITSEGKFVIGQDSSTDGVKLDVDGKVKAKDLELSPEGTFEAGTFKGNRLQLGIRQEPNTFVDYGSIQAGNVGTNNQISFTAENNVRFAFINGKVVVGEPTNSDALLNVGGIVSANQFTGNGSELTGITAEQVGAIANINNATPTAGRINLVEDGAIAITSVLATNQITIGENHSRTTNNPHQVTAEQVEAIASVDGVSNPGGNIDLIQDGAIRIIPDNNTNQITISEIHSSSTDNPHGVNAKQVGAIASLDGVSHAGGDIDLIARNAITIESDQENHLIIIGENHSNIQQGNPHQVTAADIGAISTEGGTIEGPLNLRNNLIIDGDIMHKSCLLQSSPRALKTNIAELSRQEANQILRGLNPIKFNYTKDPINTIHIGFIAEDVPDLVASSDKKAIYPIDIVAVLTKTVQDQEQTISQLTNLVDDQKHEIEILQENFTRLSELLQEKERRKKQRRLSIRAFWRKLKRLYSKTFRLGISHRDRD